MADTVEDGLDDLVFADEFAGLATTDGGVEPEGADFVAEASPQASCEKDGLASEMSVRERLAKLFDGMIAYRRELLAIIDFCSQPKECGEVRKFVAEMQRFEPSAFSAENLCSLLEEAGGLVKLDSEGEPFDPSQVKPKEVVADGAAYYEISSDGTELFYCSTAEALELLGQNDSNEKINALFEERSDFMFAIQAILEMADGPNGVQIKEIDDRLLADPRMGESKWRPNSFLNKLEEAGAVAWSGSWRTTPFGKELLGDIAGNGVSDGEIRETLNI